VPLWFTQFCLRAKCLLMAQMPMLAAFCGMQYERILAAYVFQMFIFFSLQKINHFSNFLLI
jgi:hypothetical protein